MSVCAERMLLYESKTYDSFLSDFKPVNQKYLNCRHIPMTCIIIQDN